MSEKILTVPDVIEARETFYPVANEWVALPDVGRDGSIGSFNLLLMQHKGMIEFCGDEEAILRPIIEVNGGAVNPSDLRWERMGHWVPRMTGRAADVSYEEIIFAPQGCKGFVCLLKVTNDSSQSLQCTLGWEGSWGETRFTIYRSRSSAGLNLGWYNKWTRTLSFEHRVGLPVAAWAVGASVPLSDLEWSLEGGREDCPSSARFRLKRTVTLAGGEWAELALYVGVNSESDGASTCVVDLQRHGWQSLLSEHLRWVEKHRLVPGRQANRIAFLCNLNGFYNYFFARGRCIDTEQWVLVTSRSPRYYVSAAFWARDAFLWSFPGILLMDRKAARETLIMGKDLYLKNAGIHSLYIDGTVLYPGFELDELCAYFIALQLYVRETEDWQIIDELGLRIFECFLDELLQRRGEDGLYATFLSPTDDPVSFPYLTYDNVLAWRALRFITNVFERWGRSREANMTGSLADLIKEAIKRHCVVRGPYGPMYAWAVGDLGDYELLDQPPGSLQLLSYYGFCSEDEEEYKNTVTWIHSPVNPHYCQEGKFPAPGCEHAPYPWVLSLCYELLNGDRARALDVLSQAELDNGIACETIDSTTGRVKTGAAFATCAGFLAFSIVQALNGE